LILSDDTFIGDRTDRDCIIHDIAHRFGQTKEMKVGEMKTPSWVIHGIELAWELGVKVVIADS